MYLRVKFTFYRVFRTILLSRRQIITVGLMQPYKGM